MGIVGLVLGLIAIVLAFVPFVTLFAWIPAIVGIILSAIGLSKSKKEGRSAGPAIAGLVLSIIALPLWIVGCTCGAACVGVACGIGAGARALDGFGLW